MRNPLSRWKNDLEYTSLVVGWSEDAGKLGDAVTNYLVEKLSGYLYYEIDPMEFFPLGGVTIEDDLVQFPESKFYICPDYRLIIFKSTTPSFEFHKFITRVLDIAEYQCKTREVYSIGSMISMSSHTKPRQLLGAFSSPEVKRDLDSYDIECNVNFETAPGQKPPLSSWLLWAAQKRNLIGAYLWIPVPFYLMSLPDPKSHKKMLEFFKQRFKLDININDFDESIKVQNEQINEARDLYPDVDDSLKRLENSLTLSEEDNVKLAKQIEEYLKARTN